MLSLHYAKVFKKRHVNLSPLTIFAYLSPFMLTQITYMYYIDPQIIVNIQIMDPVC